MRDCNGAVCHVWVFQFWRRDTRRRRSRGSSVTEEEHRGEGGHTRQTYYICTRHITTYSERVKKYIYREREKERETRTHTQRERERKMNTAGLDLQDNRTKKSFANKP